MKVLYIAIVIAGVLVASVSQLFLKSSSSSNHKSVITEYLNFKVLFGYALMFLVLGGDIYSMAHGIKAKEVSILESLSYLFVPVLAYISFGEKISVRKTFAICIIFAGVIIFFL